VEVPPSKKKKGLHASNQALVWGQLFVERRNIPLAGIGIPLHHSAQSRTAALCLQGQVIMGGIGRAGWSGSAAGGNPTGLWTSPEMRCAGRPPVVLDTGHWAYERPQPKIDRPKLSVFQTTGRGRNCGCARIRSLTLQGWARNCQLIARISVARYEVFIHSQLRLQAPPIRSTKGPGRYSTLLYHTT